MEIHKEMVHYRQLIMLCKLLSILLQVLPVPARIGSALLFIMGILALKLEPLQGVASLMISAFYYMAGRASLLSLPLLEECQSAFEADLQMLTDKAYPPRPMRYADRTVH